MIISQIFTVAAISAPWWSLSSFWNSLSALQWAAAISALILTVGAVLEYWEKLKLLTLLIGKWALRKSTAFDRCVLKKLLIHSAGPLLVVFGIAGDFVFEGRAFILEDKQEEQARQTIGSLGEIARKADEKAKTAISDSSIALDQAKDALAKAKLAQSELASAETDAHEAQVAASNALAVATDASTRAGNAETSLGKAEAEANSAEQSASNALTLAQETKELEATLEGRKLTPEQQSTMIGVLKAFLRHPQVEVESYGLDGEGIVLATQIMHVVHLGTGTMPKDLRANAIVTGGFEMGVIVRGPYSENEFMSGLREAFHAVGMEAWINPPSLSGSGLRGKAAMEGSASISGGAQTLPPDMPKEGTPVHIMVGIKPIPDLLLTMP